MSANYSFNSTSSQSILTEQALQELYKKRDRYEKELKSCNEQPKQIELQLKIEKISVQLFQNALNLVKSDKQKLENELDLAQRKVQKLSKENSDLTKLDRTHRDKLTGVNLEISRLRQDIQKLTQKEAEWAVQNKRLSNKIKDHEREKGVLIGQVQRLQDEEHKKINELEKQNKLLKRSLTVANSDLQKKTELAKKLRKENTILKELGCEKDEKLSVINAAYLRSKEIKDLKDAPTIYDGVKKARHDQTKAQQKTIEELKKQLQDLKNAQQGIEALISIAGENASVV